MDVQLEFLSDLVQLIQVEKVGSDGAVKYKSFRVRVYDLQVKLESYMCAILGLCCYLLEGDEPE